MTNRDYELFAGASEYTLLGDEPVKIGKNNFDFYIFFDKVENRVTFEALGNKGFPCSLQLVPEGDTLNNFLARIMA